MWEECMVWVLTIAGNRVYECIVQWLVNGQVE